MPGLDDGLPLGSSLDGAGELVVSDSRGKTRAKISLHVASLKFRTREGSYLQALRDVDFDVLEGEFLSVVGPSGCGKSTLLNVIAGLLHPSEALLEGQVDLYGQDTSKRLGYVLQKDTLLPWRTLLGNVEIGLEIQGVAKATRRNTAQRWIERVGLQGFERAYPRELSGGMRQRASIVRVLAYDPDVILMDEPFGALDAQTRTMLQQQLLDLWSGSGKTVLFVTHDLEEATLMSDRVILLTPRPASVRRVYRIDIPRPRVIRELKTSDRFVAIYREIWQDLCEELGAET